MVRGGRVRLYRDLYKDLRQRLPCGEACRLIEAGLRLSRTVYMPWDVTYTWETMGDRARAIASLKRLARYADLRDWERRARAVMAPSWGM